MHVLNGGLARHLAADRRANESGEGETDPKETRRVGGSEWVGVGVRMGGRPFSAFSRRYRKYG